MLLVKPIRSTNHQKGDDVEPAVIKDHNDHDPNPNAISWVIVRLTHVSPFLPPFAFVEEFTAYALQAR